MKLVLSRDVLNAALQSVSRVVATRNTIPILANLWIGAEGSSLKMRATDLDVEAEASCEARISLNGATTVHAATLRDIVDKTTRGAEISMEIEKDQLVVRSGRSRFKLSMLPVEDFPDMAAVEASHSFSLPAVDFDKMLARTAFAMSQEETRYYLNGIYFHEVDGRLRAVATDGHRLARTDGLEIAGAVGMPSVIVPRKAIDEFRRLCAKPTGFVDISVSKAKLCVKFPNGVKLTSKLIDGTFPDYVRVIPTNNEILCSVGRDDMIGAVTRVSTLAQKGSTLRLGMSKGKMQLGVLNPDAGASSDEIDAYLDGAPIDVGMSPRYLLDILGAMGGDHVEFRISEPVSPVLIQDPSDSASLFVLMPLR